MYAPRSQPGDQWTRGPEPGSARRGGGSGHRARPSSDHGPTRSRLGSLPARGGVNIVLGSVGLGMLAALVAGTGPGLLLGVFLIAGTVAAVLLVRPRVVHLIIPVPALAYLAAGMIVGYIHDRAGIVSRTALAVAALQWIASGFFAIVAATALAIAMTVVARRVRRRTRRAPSALDPRDQSSPVDEYRSWDDYYRRDEYGRRDGVGGRVPRGQGDRYRPLDEYGARNDYDLRDEYKARGPYGPGGRGRGRARNDDYGSGRGSRASR
jgi:hypothetical protein